MPRTSVTDTKATPALLLPASQFAPVAKYVGFAESASTLVLSGRLTRVQVGSRTYYRMSELEEIWPEAAMRKAAERAVRRGGST
jgi:hypothetical protein